MTTMSDQNILYYTADPNSGYDAYDDHNYLNSWQHQTTTSQRYLASSPNDHDESQLDIIACLITLLMLIAMTLTIVFMFNLHVQIDYEDDYLTDPPAMNSHPAPEPPAENRQTHAHTIITPTPSLDQPPASSTTLPAAPPTPSFDLPSWFRSDKLPYSPLQYNISLNLNTADNVSVFNGNVSILLHMNATIPITSLTLDAVNITISKAQLTLIGPKNKTFSLKAVPISPKAEGFQFPMYVTFESAEAAARALIFVTIFAVVELFIAEKLLENTSVILSLSYTGFYQVHREISTSSVPQCYGICRHKNTLFTVSEPTFTASIFPCIMTPLYKTTFFVNLSYPESDIAIFNTEAESEETKAEGFITKHFKKTPLIAPHSVGFVIGNIRTVNETQSANISVFYTRDHFPTDIDDLIRETAKYYTEVRTYLGIQRKIVFPLRIAFIDGLPWEGVTLWQLIFIQDHEKMYPAVQKQIIRRQIVQTWAGALVTPMFWNYSWIQEGLSELYGTPSRPQYTDSMQWRKRLFVDLKWFNNRSMLRNPSYSRGPFEIHDEYFNEFRRLEAALYLSTLRSFVSPNLFDLRLGSFFDYQKHAAIEDTDLFTALRLSDIECRSWTLSTGRPVIYVKELEKEFVLTREILFDRTPISRTKPVNLSIPICYLFIRPDKSLSIDLALWMHNNELIVYKNDPHDVIILSPHSAPSYLIYYQSTHLWDTTKQVIPDNFTNYIHIVENDKSFVDTYGTNKQ